MVLAAPPEHSAWREQQLELEWMVGEAPIERPRIPRWRQEVSQLEADEFAEEPVSTFDLTSPWPDRGPRNPRSRLTRADE